MTTPRELKLLYEQGVNVSAHLRREQGVEVNTPEIIDIAYDLQAGSYLEAMKNPVHVQNRAARAKEIARIILSLCKPASILEAGVGEATTLSGVARNLDLTGLEIYAFDLSWSRAALAGRWLKHNGVAARLCTGNLFHIPFSDSSVDLVFTSHAIEPNGGSEEAILRELFRVTRKFLLLIEPAYELCDDEARARMDANGYCKNLPGTAASLGCEIVDHRLFPHLLTPLNPSALTIIRKGADAEAPATIFACPRYKTPLRELGGMMYSPEALSVYPIIGSIPCLRIENGVFASRYEDVMKAG